MAQSRVEGSQALRNVLSFTLRHWGTRKGLLAGITFAMLFSTLTEVIVPVFAGHLVDALEQGRSAAGEALRAFGAMAALGLFMVGLRHVAWNGVVPLTLSMMCNIALDTFHRVQRFSTDWHNNSFAGSTVRKITRGMWALDSLNDVLLLALLPALVVLVTTVILLGNQWPIMGVIMAVGVFAYTTLAVVLATQVIAPVSRLSNALDTRMGGVLSDSLGANAVVKSF
jgi:ATP-binding cassette subfamily B protein